MPKPLNYRRRLLAIVDTYLDPTDISHARAHLLLHRLAHARRFRFHTIDEMVWSGFASELNDSLFNRDAAYLHQTRQTLLHGSPELHRTYLRYDFRSFFTEVERDWHNQLLELAAWLQTKPFSEVADDLLPISSDWEPQAEYERRVQAVRAVSDQTPPPPQIGEETLYHFILRTAEAVLTAIHPFYSARFSFLVVAPPFTAYNWDRSNPTAHQYLIDAEASIAWASRALKAISLQDWVWLTWQVTATSYVVSLH